MQVMYFFGSVSQGVEVAEEEKKASKKVQKKIAKRQDGLKLDAHLEEQFASGRLLACISSRPGQCGRSDGYVKQQTCRSSERMLSREGVFDFLAWRICNFIDQIPSCRYILEGKELEFYQKKIQKKKGKGAAA